MRVYADGIFESLTYLKSRKNISRNCNGFSVLRVYAGAGRALTGFKSAKANQLYVTFLGK